MAKGGPERVAKRIFTIRSFWESAISFLLASKFSRQPDSRRDDRIGSHLD